ncbi:hypothetical protein ENU1_019680 [Entamoeba nuttalli P19]|uniref:Uncharacterized protein n=1 Tax=Entamoeba nuttalli (strain P19) TaxID=1076696 RepID=K2H7D1_ENTNP|nr:hypothetical protein ENU1_019680 [Entamoeba nuttalli P19]EKE42487.1 hypothetical protein ENU1_019680 [Entamoeba nuttalli P19]|eukprot:XP_008855179.1 hypothetical protein ENU1_019680 [Entamoeba nuttalli P19]
MSESFYNISRSTSDLFIGSPSISKKIIFSNKKKQQKLKDIYEFWGFLWSQMFKILEEHCDGLYLTKVPWKISINQFVPSVKIKYLTLINIFSYSTSMSRVDLQYTGPHGVQTMHELIQGYVIKQYIRKQPLLETCCSKTNDSLKLMQRMVPMYYLYDYGTIEFDSVKYDHLIYSVMIPFIETTGNGFISVSIGFLLPEKGEINYEKIYDMINFFMWNFVQKHISTQGKGDNSQVTLLTGLQSFVQCLEEYIVTIDIDYRKRLENLKTFEKEKKNRLKRKPSEHLSLLLSQEALNLSCSNLNLSGESDLTFSMDEDQLPNQRITQTPGKILLRRKLSRLSEQPLVEINTTSQTDLDESNRIQLEGQFSFVKECSNEIIENILYGYLMSFTTIVIPSDGRNLNGIRRLLSPFNTISIYKPKTVFGHSIVSVLNPLIDVSFMMEIPSSLETLMGFPYCVIDLTNGEVYLSEEVNTYDYFLQRSSMLLSIFNSNMERSMIVSPSGMEIIDGTNLFTDWRKVLISNLERGEYKIFDAVLLKMVEWLRMKSRILFSFMNLGYFQEMDMMFMVQLKIMLNCKDLEDLMSIVAIVRSGEPSLADTLLQAISRAITTRKEKIGQSFI